MKALYNLLAIWWPIWNQLWSCFILYKSISCSVIFSCNWHLYWQS